MRKYNESMKIENVEITKIELEPFVKVETPSLNHLVSALVSHQFTPVSGFPKLIDNMTKYRNSHFSYVQINGIKFRLFYNPTRKENIIAETFTATHQDFKCQLCELLPGQRGIKVLDGKYMIIVNPGITIPGDLTIPTIKHDLQIISDKLPDMLTLSKELTDYSIFFNGPMAGASCPHFHFQAGIRNRLPAEIDINRLLENPEKSLLRKKIIYQDNCTEIFRIENFLRTAYLCYTEDIDLAKQFGHYFMENLKTISQKYLQNQKNIPDFGTYIDVFDANETEARFNIMAKYHSDSGRYLLVFFPKTFSRPQSFYNSENKITLGFGIKEALGHILTANKQDYFSILNDINVLRQAYIDTSLSKEMDEKLFDLIKSDFPAT